MQTLLVGGSPPLIPATARGERPPISSIRYGPHSERSAGRSPSRRKTPLLVPPRNSSAGTEINSLAIGRSFARVTANLGPASPCLRGLPFPLGAGLAVGAVRLRPGEVRIPQL